MVALGNKYETIKNDEKEMESQTKSDTRTIEKDIAWLWRQPTSAPCMCWFCKMPGHFMNEYPLSKSNEEIMPNGLSIKMKQNSVNTKYWIWARLKR